MERDISIVTTLDGSQTIRNNTTGDTYHSIYGAVQESQHIFIKHGIDFFLHSFPERKNIRILEVGLGTALNALLTARYAQEHKVKVEYVALEPYPLEKNVYHHLNYGTGEESVLKFHDCPWDTPVEFSSNFSFTKHSSKIELIELPGDRFDVIYYDAFAPNSQPEMWTKETLSRVVFNMNVPSVFVTYCAKGQVKRDLKELGLRVENPVGPPGKRSMLRAEKH